MLRRIARRLLHRVRPEPAAAPRPAAAPAEPPPPAEELDAARLARLDAGAQEVFERVDTGEPVSLLDVRGPEEHAARRIPGSLHIPLDELERRWTEVRELDEVICYSDTGERSRRAATLLREKGVFQATSLEGGLAAWAELGGPLEGEG